MKIDPIPGTFVVGLGHKARHGKGTTADCFLDYLGGQAREFAFADAIRAYCRVARGMTAKDAPLLQQVGTEEFRAKDPDVWIRTLYWTVRERTPRVAIISDVRFPNEVQMVRDMGGIMIKVTRLNADGTPFVDPSRPADHISECSLNDYDGWDHTLCANSVGLLRFQSMALIDHISQQYFPTLRRGEYADSV